jgi:WhiB family redox-sensing transcriptional regulator
VTSPRRGLTSAHGTSTGGEHWAERGACRSFDPELFFPDGRGNGSQYLAYVEARQVCSGCPVRRECLRAATKRREPWGVWGGELFDAGRVIHPKRPRPHAPQPDGEAAA